MARRLHPTLADYMAIAINPALIMGLVGSLVYFLLEVLYQGAYPDRLRFCLTMFVFAMVLISRIAMEEGWERAAPFGIALAIVVAMALGRFVVYHDSSLARFGTLINWGLMAITWWSAHKLTWDCTVLDESDEATGTGLLETIGVDRPQTGEDAEAAAAERLKSLARHQRKKVRWEELLNRPREPHSHGAWVVYFSLASLPIFGIGQLFIPASNTASRRYVFELLCVYMACGLGLLLTTSFISMRRYLRQRRLQMPSVMAATWLTTGTGLIVALLLLTAFLPRPYPEYSVSELSLRLGSDKHDASRYSVGKEGTQDDDKQPDTGTDDSPDSSTDPKDPSAAQSESAKDQQGQVTSQQKNDKGQASESSTGESDKDSQGSGKQGSSTQPNGKGSQQSSGNSSKQRKAPGNSSQSSQQPPSSPDPASPPTSAIQSVISMLGMGLGALVKLIAYGAIILAVIYAIWYWWPEVKQLIAYWRELWQSLFGRPKRLRRQTDFAEIVNQQPVWTFNELLDPFAAGTAGQYSAKELVRYTFLALEAWGRDHSCPRQTDQTIHEFAIQIGSQFRPLSTSVRSLAELYGRAAYSDRSISPSSVNQLAHLWQLLRSTTTQSSTVPP